MTLSTSPAISSDGFRGCGEEALILIEVYAVGVVPGPSATRLFKGQREGGTYKRLFERQVPGLMVDDEETQSNDETFDDEADFSDREVVY